MKKSEVEKLVQELYSLNKEFAIMNDKMQARRNEIQEEIERYLDVTGDADVQASYKSDDEDLILRVQRVMRKKVNYKADRLEVKLGKEKTSKFISRKYVIRDWNAVVKLLKKHKVPAHEFTKLIEVIKDVDTDRLDQEEAVGNISYDDLKGCFTVDYLSSYVRLTKRKRQ